MPRHELRFVTNTTGAWEIEKLAKSVESVTLTIYLMEDGKPPYKIGKRPGNGNSDQLSLSPNKKPMPIRLIPADRKTKKKRRHTQKKTPKKLIIEDETFFAL